MREDSKDDFYERLGVTPRADAREIRRRYLELVARYHPDRHQGNPLGDLAKEKLAEINAAYDVLSDTARRAAYDTRARSPGGAAGDRGPPGASGTPGHSGGFGPRRHPGRTVITLVVLAVSALLGLRLAPGLGRFFAGIFGPGPGRILAPVLLAGVLVAVIAWSRARRSK